MTEREQQKRAYTKLNNAVETMWPMLKAASEAAHETGTTSVDDDGEREFNRIVELGHVVDISVNLCAAHLEVLFYVACALSRIENGERPEQSPREQLHQ